MSIFDEHRDICIHCGARISDWDGSVDHTNGGCVTYIPSVWTSSPYSITTTTCTDSSDEISTEEWLNYYLDEWESVGEELTFTKKLLKLVAERRK